ncbi:hypothetical protein [Fibrella aquatilis]|uniref:Uncharacterized protein n=1 Tax=Fibrella aquatilis TaxID=2817059 RepID=A0A939G7Q0_9BACT|nr:hypothetical protein [Fibrella aquatilis]MBO0931905.1 hypothetical protein [Fibrella aquatilis]
MSLDKYRRTAPAPTESAPSLDNPGESLRQKADRYHHFVDADIPNAPTQPVNALEPASKQPIPSDPDKTTAQLLTTKGNKFKSNKPTLPRPKAASRKEPTSQSGVKIVFVDETMRDEYIQLAGYLMVKHRIKLTMTAYFCFLHDQAVAQQADETFLNALAQFAQPRS